MKNKLLNVCITLCFVVGLLLIFISPIQNFLVERASNKLLETPIEVFGKNSDPAVSPADDVPQTYEHEFSYDFEEVQSLTIWDVLEAQAKVKNMPAIGSIYIPSVDMTLPILTGVGKYALAVGAGTMKRSQKMGKGNYALASHYIEGKSVLFGPLYHLKEGDSIFLTDTEFMYEYKTTDIKVIKATDVYIIDDVAGKTLLTLITCAQKGTHRLSVRAELIAKTPADKSKDKKVASNL